MKKRLISDGIYVLYIALGERGNTSSGSVTLIMSWSFTAGHIKSSLFFPKNIKTFYDHI